MNPYFFLKSNFPAQKQYHVDRPLEASKHSNLSSDQQMKELSR